MPNFETSNGVTIHYEECGVGLPLVFVHGWAMSGRVWRFQRSLATKYRFIAIDLRGHGKSSASGMAFGMIDLAADLTDLFSHLVLDRTVLVGWSLGSQVSLQACDALRERLAGLVLVGGTPKFTSSAEYPHGLPAVEVKGMDIRLRRDYQKTMGEFFHRMFAEGELSSEQYQRIVHEIVIGGRLPSQEVARQTLEGLNGADQRGLLTGIDLPVLLIHGDRDTICPPSASYYMSEHLPQVRLEIFPGVGHAPFLSQPEKFNKLLQKFAGEIYGCN